MITVKVIEIDGYFITGRDGEGNLYKRMIYTQVQGIPLTDTIFLKTKFEKISKSYSWFIEVNDRIFELQTYPGKPGLYYQDINHELKYVHQLQNLFICLTETELEINI